MRNVRRDVVAAVSTACTKIHFPLRNQIIVFDYALNALRDSLEGVWFS